MNTRTLFRLAVLALAPSAWAIAAQPAELAAALQSLRDQRSYSWEVINGDPGPVAQEQQTRRGKVTTVRQNSSPHVKGTLAQSGESLFRLDWPDGLQMDAFVSVAGTNVIKTPEGWMTGPEVLAALADDGEISRETVAQAIVRYRIDPDRPASWER